MYTYTLPVLNKPPAKQTISQKKSAKPPSVCTFLLVSPFCSANRCAVASNDGDRHGNSLHCTFFLLCGLSERSLTFWHADHWIILLKTNQMPHTTKGKSKMRENTEWKNRLQEIWIQQCLARTRSAGARLHCISQRWWCRSLRAPAWLAHKQLASWRGKSRYVPYDRNFSSTDFSGCTLRDW